MMQVDPKSYVVTNPGRVGKIALGIGIVGVLISVAGYLVDAPSFFFSYLTSYFFWLSIGLGGLFFTMLHHLVDAKWSITVRRITESLAAVIPYMLLLLVPALLGMDHLYKWSVPSVAQNDHLLSHKSPFLNIPFFLARIVLYFGVWTFLAYSLRKLSLQQDTCHTPEFTKSVRRLSAPGMFAFALTTTFASFDWLMSLDPHWYSTIFGVYLFAGSVIGTIAFVTILSAHMRRRGILVKEITSHHYHDFGKLLFAFVIFWAYMAFSQYFLIWYANIPEETIWFLHRWEGSWKIVSLILIFGHFALPFIFLVSRMAKGSLVWLLFVAGWLLIMHYIDLSWIIMPIHHPHGAHYSWVDLGTLMAVGGLFVWQFWRIYTAKPIIPVGDPGLPASVNFVNIG